MALPASSRVRSKAPCGPSGTWTARPPCFNSSLRGVSIPAPTEPTSLHTVRVARHNKRWKGEAVFYSSAQVSAQINKNRRNKLSTAHSSSARSRQPTDLPPYDGPASSCRDSDSPDSSRCLARALASNESATSRELVDAAVLCTGLGAKSCLAVARSRGTGRDRSL